MTELPLPSDGTFALMVVGESHYQEALEAICGGRSDESADELVTAHLRLEDANPYDRNAVRVEISRRLVGYLSRPDAIAYRAYLQERGVGVVVGVCEARVRGGWERGSDRGHFGVWLDFQLYSQTSKGHPAAEASSRGGTLAVIGGGLCVALAFLLFLGSQDILTRLGAAFLLIAGFVLVGLSGFFRGLRGS